MTGELCVLQWRLWCVPDTLGVVTATSSTSSLASRVLNWLRAGYPDGVPGPDRVPLLSLLRSTPLTEDQVKEIVRTITGK